MGWDAVDNYLIYRFTQKHLEYLMKEDKISEYPP